MQSLQQYVKSAKADLWVGQDDKQIHRFSTTVDGVTDDSTKTSSGIEGFKITDRRVGDADIDAVRVRSVEPRADRAAAAGSRRAARRARRRRQHLGLTDAGRLGWRGHPIRTAHMSASPCPGSPSHVCSSLLAALGACASAVAPAGASGPFRIGMVADTNGVYDHSFNQLAYAGVSTAALRLGANILVLASPSVPRTSRPCGRSHSRATTR